MYHCKSTIKQLAIEISGCHLAIYYIYVNKVHSQKNIVSKSTNSREADVYHFRLWLRNHCLSLGS